MRTIIVKAQFPDGEPFLLDVCEQINLNRERGPYLTGRADIDGLKLLDRLAAAYGFRYEVTDRIRTWENMVVVG